MAVIETIETKPDVLIAADTIVCSSDGSILEKPVDRDHARKMLSQLSGGVARVLTAVSIWCRGGEERKVDTADVSVQRLHGYTVVEWVHETKIAFFSLPAEVIEAYISTDEP